MKKDYAFIPLGPAVNPLNDTLAASPCFLHTLNDKCQKNQQEAGLLAAKLAIFLMIKQITMMVTLGVLLTVGALMTISLQHASADQTTNGNGRSASPAGDQNFGSNGVYGAPFGSNPEGQGMCKFCGTR